MRILILEAHPRPSASIAQHALRKATRGLVGVTHHDLYAHYPDFGIDAAREQDLLENHDIIIFQHPFYWYSSPAILKEWQDIVLDFGWAYGPDGTHLRGKFLMSAITTGGAEHFYHPNGRNRFTIDQMLAPFNQTAHLCGMAYLRPFVMYEGRKISEGELAARADDYRALLEGLAKGTLKPLDTLAEGYKLPDGFKAAVRA